MKKILCLLLCLCLLFPLCSGCGRRDGDKLEILCTVFPLYDWVKNIVGESETVEVSLLITNGSDLHSYQPSAEDIIRISSADLFFYVGGSSDAWVEETLKNQASDERIDVKMTEIPDIRLREMCMDSTAEHHDHDHGGVDEHLWLSLFNAKTASAYLTERLCELDEEHAETYRENFIAYESSLDALNEEYAALVSAKDAPRMLCADRFPFVYLAEDYGIEYICAFEGCSTDANASAETISRLAKALDAYALSSIVTTERPCAGLAESVRDASAAKNQKIFALDSMQSVTKKDADGGADYLELMKQNLETLRQILGD